MLHFFRKHAHSIVVRVILGAIALSFCFWGLGSLFQSKPEQVGVVAYAGKIPITLKSVLAQMDDSNVPEEDRAKEYPRVLQKHLAQHISFQESQRLDMRIPDALVRQSIRSLPFLHTDKGQFDGAKLQTLLTNGAIKKDALLSYAYAMLTSKQINALFQSHDLFPPSHALLLFQELHTPRDVTVYPFETHSAKELAAIANDFLASEDFETFLNEQYDQSRTKFVPGLSIPATCRIQALHIAKEYFPAPVISKQELNQVISERFPRRTVRTLVRIEAPTKDDVSATITALQNRAEPPKTAEVESTTVSSDEPSPLQWAENAGSLRRVGDHTAITSEGDAFTAVFLSDATEQDTAPKDKKVIEKIEQELAMSRQQAEADNLRTQLEADATSMEALRKSAGKHARSFTTAPLTRQGVTLFGLSAQHLYGAPLDTEAMDSVFTASPDQIDTPITLSDGSHVFFVVLENKPASVRTRKDLHAAPLHAAFLSEKMHSVLEKKATEISEKLKKNKKHNPEDLGYTTRPSFTIKKHSLLTPVALDLNTRIKIASLRPNEHSAVFIEGRPTIMLVTKEYPVDPSSNVEAYKQFKLWLERSVEKDLQDAWGKTLYDTHKVSVIAPTYDQALKLKS